LSAPAVISFIVPAHNEERYLGATLTAIRAAAEAAGKPFELIVVDDASIDATASVARTHGAAVVPVNLRHIAAARNAGARAASGDVLIFVDADTLLPAATLAAALDALDRGAAGGGARVQMEANAPRWVHRVWGLVSLMNWLRLAAGCFMFMRRDAFDAVGGYDERLFCGEEVFLSRALSAQGSFVIVRPTVITSARKFEQASMWDVVKLMVPMMTWSAMKRRHDWWYGRQRDAGAEGEHEK
jgi:glycosyltransferase involved in cell wall biosynthesis